MIEWYCTCVVSKIEFFCFSFIPFFDGYPTYLAVPFILPYICMPILILKGHSSLNITMLSWFALNWASESLFVRCIMSMSSVFRSWFLALVNPIYVSPQILKSLFVYKVKWLNIVRALHDVLAMKPSVNFVLLSWKILKWPLILKFHCLHINFGA